MIIIADIKQLFGDKWIFYRYYSVPSAEDTSLFIDMFDGTGVLDFNEQYQNLIQSGKRRSIQEFTLLKTFIKWGEIQEERITFKVILYQCRFQWIYLLKRFWYFKLLKKTNRGNGLE